MQKLWIFGCLFIVYAAYSSWVYTQGTDTASSMNANAAMGKRLYQQYNCQSCHQIFGLGGYLGPELTTVISDKKRGALYAKILLENGGGTYMPNFHFKPQQVNALLDYLKYVDTNAYSYK